jgi:putative ABC transport system substrate-binding protein
MNRQYLLAILLALSAIIIMVLSINKHQASHRLIAIANYGPHASLTAAITGFKNQMAAEGFIEHHNIDYLIKDVGFDQNLIPQMLISLKAAQPELIVVMTTPVASIAKNKITDIPLVYTVITDPVEAGLIPDESTPGSNITGSSERQDLSAFLNFAQSLLPQARRIGLLYATSESNDLALLRMMRDAAKKHQMSVVAIPIDQPRDIPVRIQDFKDKVDFIYVGTSGPIQPSLPVISSYALKMKIPVFNADSQAVRDGLALGSFGVDYESVGAQAARLSSAILNGRPVSSLDPLYPSAEDHTALVNKKLADMYALTIPQDIEVVS